jgi:hypothetical protein
MTSKLTARSATEPQSGAQPVIVDASAIKKLLADENLDSRRGGNTGPFRVLALPKRVSTNHASEPHHVFARSLQ